jgi:hypothetical protein
MWSPHNQEKQKMNTDISDLVEESLSHRAVNHLYLNLMTIIIEKACCRILLKNLEFTIKKNWMS